MRTSGMVQGIHRQQPLNMMHLFPAPTYELLEKEMTELSEGNTGFTNPFRYAPHPLVKIAARHTLEMIAASEELCGHLSQGKMLGVLVVMDHNGRIGYLSGFSGLVGGRTVIGGFVPPIFDLNDTKGRYRREEAEISGLNDKIRALTTGRMAPIQNDLKEIQKGRDTELSMLRSKKACLRKEDPEFIRQSQFINAEIKRTKGRWKGIIAKKEDELSEIRREVDTLRRRRAKKSDELQQWIFRQYIVHNALGESMSVWDIFAERGIVPPGGTGECAAPKLLEYAYRNGLKPIAMGEFWYGRSPDTAVRTHGHFYPSCTSKCGPLLDFMMIGLKGRMLQEPPPALAGTPYPGVETSIPHTSLSGTEHIACNHTQHSPVNVAEGTPKVIYEDEWIVVVEKPSGMPSVPGLDGQTSLLEWLDARDSGSGTIHEAVHRLDMDTSGIMLFAKNPKAAVNLRKQFEEHTVRKTYMARLCPSDHNRFTPGVHDLKTGETGRIGLPLSADYDERPRQKADMMHGKPTLTLYEVSSVNTDGTIDILFHPHTGRTHQLRVHAAHILGLGHPILGDTLYGGCHTSLSVSDAAAPTPHRLHLHALSITFTHPGHDSEMTFTSTSLAY